MYATTLVLSQTLEPHGQATILGDDGKITGHADLLAWRQKFTVTLRPGNACGPICSSRLGVLIKEPLAINRATTVTLPLESTDILYASWAENK